jgi:hypothetical protein
MLQASGVTLELIPAGERDSAFGSGYESDGNAGGWVSEIYSQSLDFVLKEKIEKTRRVANLFDGWILLLVDMVMPGTVWATDVGPLRPDMGHFSEVMVINPDGSLATVITP